MLLTYNHQTATFAGATYKLFSVYSVPLWLTFKILYALSASTTASPIAAVPTSVQPSDIISGVRKP